MASDRSRVSKQSYIDKRKEDEAKLQQQINESDAKRAAHASNVYGIINQYAYGDMAPKQPSPVISIYDIEKEKQAQRDAEKAKVNGRNAESPVHTQPAIDPNLSPDEQLALANAAKGTSGGYTNSPQSSNGRNAETNRTSNPSSEPTVTSIGSEEFAKKIYDIVTPYMYGDMAPKNPSKVVSVYDIEKERQAKRDAEKEKAKSDAGVYIASQNPNMFHPGSPTPSSQIENIDTRGAMHPGSEVYIPEEPKGLNRVSSAAPTPDVDESSTNPSAQGDGGADTSNESAQQPSNPYQDFAKLWQKPITPEEEARRERAARAVQGVAGLGNLMSAFANLTFTGKGAPSQTLPTQQVDAMGKEMTSWKDKLKAEREKYQAAELGAKVEQWKAELDAQHRAQEQANVDRAYDFQVKQHDDNVELAKGKAQAEAQETQKRLALVEKRLDIARQEANTKLYDSQRKDKPYPMIVDGQLYEIPISRVNEQMIGSIFAKLPEEVRNSAGQPIYGEDIYGKKTIVGYKNPSLSDMLAAIGTHGNEETAILIKGLAGETVEKKDNGGSGFSDGGGRGTSAKSSQVGEEKKSFSTKSKE